MRMLELLGIILIMTSLAALIWVWIVIVVVFCKAKISRMNPEQWEKYFAKFDEKKVLTLIATTYGLALLIASYLGYWVFLWCEHQSPLLWSCAIFLIGAITRYLRFQKNGDEFQEKITTLVKQLNNPG